MKRTKEVPQDGNVSGDAEPLSPKAQLLTSGILKANDVVHRTSKSKEAYQGMGSTVSAVYFTRDTLIVGNVGDSPIYLIRNGEIKTVSVPHTMMAEFIALAPKGAKLPDKKFGHMLTRAMGTKETVQPDVSEIPAVKDDILVISSRGRRMMGRRSPQTEGVLALEESLRVIFCRIPICRRELSSISRTESGAGWDCTRRARTKNSR